MSGGSEFHAAGPACEKDRSPNLVRSRGVTYLLLEADRRPVRVAALLDVRTMSLRYAGHLPVCIPYMIVHRLVNTTARSSLACLFFFYNRLVSSLLRCELDVLVPSEGRVQQTGVSSLLQCLAAASLQFVSVRLCLLPCPSR